MKYVSQYCRRERERERGREREGERELEWGVDYEMKSRVWNEGNCS